MRIVEINTVCDTGSTGRVAAGIARCATAGGNEAYVAYGRGSHPEDINGYKIGDPADFAGHVMVNFFKGSSGFSSKRVTEKFLLWLDMVKPDVLHLHNIHGFYIHVGMLFEYIKKNEIPVIWTLHDCWAFTGQCAYFDNAGCDKWITGCSDCPVYRSDYPYSLFKDNSKGNYSAKKAAFTGVENLMIVTPSKWLEGLVKKSYLSEYDTTVIYNGIDLNRFRILAGHHEKPADLRERYGIKKEEKVILGVANVWSKRKGLECFLKLTELLPDDHRIVLIGVSDKITRGIRQRFGDRIICIKHTDSVDELVDWYNTADVFANPTLEDNFPSTDIEALACGTPVVAFDTGGCGEIEDRECVKIAPKGDVSDLAKRIMVITDTKSRGPLSARCRSIAERYCAGDRFAEYLDIADRMLCVRK